MYSLPFLPLKAPNGIFSNFTIFPRIPKYSRRKCKVGENAILGLSKPELVRNACFYIELFSVTYDHIYSQIPKYIFSQNCHTISTKELICMRVCVFINYNPVLLQFYAQFYSDSMQIYHCKNYMTSFYFYHSIKFPLTNLCKG